MPSAEIMLYHAGIIVLGQNPIAQEDIFGICTNAEYR